MVLFLFHLQEVRFLPGGFGYNVSVQEFRLKAWATIFVFMMPMVKYNASNSFFIIRCVVF